MSEHYKNISHLMNEISCREGFIQDYQHKIEELQARISKLREQQENERREKSDLVVELEKYKIIKEGE